MLTPLRVVTPYTPFAPEGPAHVALGPFDWLDAVRMLETSVWHSNHCETAMLTTPDVVAPGIRRLTYETSSTRLMLWILEVASRYLESDDFDRDTVMVSPDCLVYRNLRPWFAGDFGILVRKHSERPILNAVQWWPIASKAALCAIYARVRKLALRCSEILLTWGADSEPFRQLFRPLLPGLRARKNWIVNLVDSREVLEPLNSGHIEALTAGRSVQAPRKTVMDFRFLRKRYMAAYFDATLGAAVTP